MRASEGRELADSAACEDGRKVFLCVCVCFGGAFVQVEKGKKE